MVPAVTEGGRSFKGAALYYLHDKRQEGERERLSSDRVAWAETLNLSTDDPERGWRIMADTAMSQADLKMAAGERTTGRKLTKPVYAYSLAWHPDEKVTREEQMEAARESLKVQGLDGYQAIILAHNDEPHAHVHIVVNRVHPENGKAATLSNNTLKLSKWAEDYERKRGKIYCEQRVDNNQKRQQGERINEPRIPRPDYEFQKASGNDSLTVDFIRSNEKQKDAQLYDIGRSIKESHTRQWAELKRVYAVSRKKINDYGAVQKDIKTAEIKDQFKDQWRALFQRQRVEQEIMGNQQFGLLSRLFNSLSMLDEFRQNSEGSRLAMFFAMVSRKGHMDALATRHEGERRGLSKAIRDVTRDAVKQIDKGTRGDLDRLRGQFLGQCAALRATQDKQVAEQRERWRVRNTERKAALAPFQARQQRDTRSQNIGRSQSRDRYTTQGGRRGPGMRPSNGPAKPPKPG
jgi:hypothetical protein